MPAEKATVRIRDIMTTSPLTVRPELSLAALATLYEGHAVDSFPVVDLHGTLCGIVTKLDLLRQLHPEPSATAPDPAEVAARTVESIMRPGTLTVEPDHPITAALDLMLETRFHNLPVVKRSAGPPRLVGIVSQGDVLRALMPES
jgi:CBS domain-containing protein